MVWLVRAATDRNPPSLGGGGCQLQACQTGIAPPGPVSSPDRGGLCICRLPGAGLLSVPACPRRGPVLPPAQQSP